MARPRKQTVDYFSHDAYASEGKTLSILFNNFGHEGISFWWQLLERVSGTNNHVIELNNPEDVEYFASKLHFTPERLLVILDKTASLNAIDKELWSHRIIWCQNLVDRLKEVYASRKQELPRKPIVTSTNNSVTSEKTLVSGTGNPQTKLKETKLKDILARFDMFWSIYPKKKSKGQAEKAFSKLNPDEQLLEVIISKIEQAMKSEDWNKEQGKYIPYPATWINAKGWEDEINHSIIKKEDTPWRFR